MSRLDEISPPLAVCPQRKALLSLPLAVLPQCHTRRRLSMQARCIGRSSAWPRCWCDTLAFYCLPLAFHCLPWAFYCLPLAFHCLPLAFHCLPLAFQLPSLDPPLPLPAPLAMLLQNQRDATRADHHTGLHPHLFSFIISLVSSSPLWCRRCRSGPRPRWPSLASQARTRRRPETSVVLLHPPLTLAGVSTETMRGCQQNDRPLAFPAQARTCCNGRCSTYSRR